MKILDRLRSLKSDCPDQRSRQACESEAHQIIIQVSILDIPRWDSRAPIFPALLDTGNNLNFSIQEPTSSGGRASIPNP